ncbi:acetyl-CoA synthetase-like protein [Thozetella sp. PMI_491]|nr:acetyl-CoA synthetase-like protein [Thozetella sp. PMI_491]
MATVIVQTPATGTVLVDHRDVNNNLNGVNQINSINELLIHRAELIPDAALISYPEAQGNGFRWIEYTARDLDAFADEVAKELSRQGLKPKARQTDQSEVVALLGPSNLDYAVTLIALSRMGFAVLFLSTRLSTEAYVGLLDKTNCSRIVADPAYVSTVTSCQERRPLESFPLLDSSLYTRQPSSIRFTRETLLINEENCVAFIIHSSGSTGLPKPILQTHRACLSNYAAGSGMRALVTTPLFHNSGIANLFRGIVAGKLTGIFNAALPLTNANLLANMEAIRPESFHCVPYILKVLAETPEGIAALARCKIVIFGGSSCPDDLGDLLVREGVCLVGHYGQTEMGQLMISKRPPGDKAWNYMRPVQGIKPFLHFEPIGDGQYEAVVLDGLPTKVMSNSDNPPNSYYTRDCFIPHPTIPDAWKCVGRLDDRITLVNGEKVLPIPIENSIRQDELVHECLVFGVGRALPGLLLIPSEKAVGLTGDELLDRVWPAIEAANTNAEKFSQISREMILVLEQDADYPATDKGTMIRAAAYRNFADLIETTYIRFETPVDAAGGRGKRLDFEALTAYLTELFEDQLKMQNLSPDTDFFAAGMDSLQAIVARGHIMRQLDLGGNILGQNVVFEHPSISQMTLYLHSLGSGSNFEADDEIKKMVELVDKYTVFQPFTPGPKIPYGDVVVLTGATGSLGAHILAQLLPLPHIRQVYCLVRAKDSAEAMSRVFSSLSTKGLSDPSIPHQTKIIALPSDLSQQDLGISPSVLAALQSTVTMVIHSAWAVNFNLGVGSFESYHIRGTRNLLDLCLAVPFACPARFAFVSSVSAASGIPSPATAPEQFIENPKHAQSMGYARSKWVTEHIVRLAAERAGVPTCVLRTGQIMGDARLGSWNSTEAIPLMIRSAVTLKALPRLDESPSWIPVDVCAQAIIELSDAATPFTRQEAASTNCHDRASIVYHVLNPRRFHWSDELLPALAATGLQFETLKPREWIQRLRDGDQDPKTNPTVKLLDFFAGKYDNDGTKKKGLVFSTDRSEQKSAAIRCRFDVIKSGLIAKCLENWLKEW